MRTTLTIISSLLFIGFVLLATFNAQSSIKRDKGEHFPSIAPFFGGIMGCVALIIFPILPLSKIAWLPLILDVGCVPYLFGAITYLIHDWWITNPRHRIKELHHSSTDCKVDVTLFRTGQVRLTKTSQLPPQHISTESHWQSIGNGGTWKEDANKLILETHQGTLTYHKISPNKYIWASSNRPTHFDNIDLEQI